ncbi:hypothetical protein D3C78_959050 [compost metagenome]
MLAVILVLQHRLYLAQALAELFAGGGAFVGTAVSVAAPVEVDLRQVLTALPQATVDGALHARAVGTGLGPEYPPAGLTSRSLFIEP